MKMDNQKGTNIQILRGIAIIAVVFIHNTPSGLAQVFCRPFLNFSVGLFLFLSGLLSNVNRWNPKKRIMKVMLPYILWTLVYVCLCNFKNPLEIPFVFLKNLITGGAAPIMYYIFIYCEFTLLIPLIDKIAKSKYRYIVFLISPIEIVIMRLLPLIMGYSINKYVQIIMSISCLGWFTYFYLGYLIGNNMFVYKSSTKKLIFLWIGAIALQVLEGYWYLSMGEANCGTQLKLSSILSGFLFMLIAYKFINFEKSIEMKGLKKIGDCSFGIYFSHLAIMSVISKLPFYSKYVFFPINAIITILISYLCVVIGRNILGKYAKYLAL